MGFWGMIPSGGRWMSWRVSRSPFLLPRWLLRQVGFDPPPPSPIGWAVYIPVQEPGQSAASATLWNTTLIHASMVIRVDKHSFILGRIQQNHVLVVPRLPVHSLLNFQHYWFTANSCCKGPDWNKQIIFSTGPPISLALYRITFDDMHHSLKRTAKSDDAFPNLFAKNDDEVIRSHTDLIEAVFEALPDIDFKQLYRYVKGVGIFKCNETTHIWEEILNCEFEYILSKLVKAHVPNLNIRELKIVGQFNQMAQLRHGLKHS
ncbi:hypothetical protein CEXT_613521 [Caerostris extrusa]|uniref:Uncharacterized protein n=1 Tax=Caerostris extrusa TaxID=172846 RepID=A0AAV4UFI7_CAEEX|nr:hypothetical protein CEXT_613521 [Caerostris extrusa]